MPKELNGIYKLKLSDIFGNQALANLFTVLQTFFLKLLLALIIFVAGKALIKRFIKITSKYLLHKNIDKALHGFILSIENMLFIVLLSLICIKTIGIDITPLITAIGAVGLAVSLAVKSSLANLAGGVFILITRPFVLDDFIEIKGNAGTVSEIRLLHTVLNAENGLIFIPNGDIASSVIINRSAKQVISSDECTGGETPLSAASRGRQTEVNAKM